MLAVAARIAYIGRMKASHQIKIITCCYCGARSTLPRTRERVALVCHGCGAAISKIEKIQPVLERAPKDRSHAKPAAPHPARRADEWRDKPARRKKGKKRRGLWYHVVEAFDDIDDLFDVEEWFD